MRLQLLVLVVSTFAFVVAFDRDEFMNATTADRLAEEHIAVRIEHNRVQEGELAGLVTRSAESREDGAGGVVKDPKNLVTTVDVEHKGLLSIFGERDVPCGSSGV